MSRATRWFLELLLLGLTALSIWILAWPRIVAARSDATGDRCRQRMDLLAVAEELRFSRTGSYQADLAALQGESGSDFVCPETGTLLILRSDGTDYHIVCPAEDSHGAVRDGLVSWDH